MKSAALRVVVNLGGVTSRSEMFEGQEYEVVPAVLMTEGVHSGSGWSLVLLLGDDLTKYAPAWNHKPIVVNHPVKNGLPISASNTTVMESSQIGFLLNVNYAEGKQKGEAWLNKEKTKNVAPIILDNIKNKVPTEVSTGLFVDNDEKPGVWNTTGESFNGRAMAHRPDHFAILTDSVGASSVADGAGLLVNRYISSAERDKMPASDFGDPAKRAFPVQTQEDLKNAADLIGHADDPAAVKRKLLAIAKRKGLKPPATWDTATTNDASTREVHQQVASQLASTYGQKGQSWGGWIEDMFPGHVIYCPGMSNGDPGPKMMKHTYSNDGKTVKLTGKPVQVVRTTDYKPVNNSGGAGNLTMKKDDFLTQFVGEGKPFAETDRASLEGLPETVLATMAKTLVAPPAPTDNQDKDKKTPPVVNTKPTTLEDVLAALGGQDKDLMSEMVTNHSERKKEFIDIIVNADGAVFTAADLKDYSLSVLKKMAAPLIKKQPAKSLLANFLGQAGVPPSGGETKQKALGGLPTVNWEKANN